MDESLPVGSVVRVRGLVTTFRSVRRVTVEALTPVDAFEQRDFLAAGTRDGEELVAELRGLVRRIRDQRIRAVVRGVFGASGFIGRFSVCPASVGRHHAYVGGLLEHTVSVANACVALAGAYPQADADLLLAAALLHDVGKVEEMAADTSIGWTDAGHLIGHVVLGERMVQAAIRDAARPLSEQQALCLTHAMLAHHGEREWGAPRSPCTLEALLLHHADHTDAQAAAFVEAVAGAAVLQQAWSDRSNGFGRALLVPAPAPSSAAATARPAVGLACA
jgi:3'-5' exoribonuclease